MSQYYSPQPNPYYPPEQGPEDEYYYEEDAEFEYDDEEFEDDAGSSLAQRGLFFCAGGLVVFLCMSCCLLAGAGLWLLDPGSSLVATPMPGSDIGLSVESAAYPEESVVNEQATKLSILQVNRNASLPEVPAVEGRELIIVTVELVNLGETVIDYNERDFVLVNPFGEGYTSLPGAVQGALGRGQLEPGAGLEGRLVFEVNAGELDLILNWDSGPDNEPRYLYLE